MGDKSQTSDPRPNTSLKPRISCPTWKGIVRADETAEELPLKTTCYWKIVLTDNKWKSERQAYTFKDKS